MYTCNGRELGGFGLPSNPGWETDWARSWRVRLYPARKGIGVDSPKTFSWLMTKKRLLKVSWINIHGFMGFILLHSENSLPNAHGEFRLLGAFYVKITIGCSSILFWPVFFLEIRCCVILLYDYSWTLDLYWISIQNAIFFQQKQFNAWNYIGTYFWIFWEQI